MRIIEVLRRKLNPTFALTAEEGAALDSGCLKAATAHPAHPRKEVLVKQSSRNYVYIDA